MTIEKVGRYEIKQEIGRGGMATVYLAHDPVFDRDVAIKLLPREFLHDPTFKSRFEREAKTIAGLEHSAIVPVHDFGEEEGQPYLVMRYMTGGSLVQRMVKGKLPLEQISRIITRLAKALDEAHLKGMIHRDLKPGNILFDTYGDAFLSDFGIVKLTEETTTLTGSGVIGTPAYMSPEQAKGDQVIDGRSDVYALGVILFELLTGKPPYEADTPIGVVLKHITEPIPSIIGIRPDLPHDLEALIERALSKEPEDRFSSAGELAERFAEIVAAEVEVAPPIKEEPPTLPEKELEVATIRGKIAGIRETPSDVKPIITPEVEAEEQKLLDWLQLLKKYQRYLIGAGGVLAVAILVLIINRRAGIPPEDREEGTPVSTSEGKTVAIATNETSLVGSTNATRTALALEEGLVPETTWTRRPPHTPTPTSVADTTPTYRPGQIRINSIDGSEMVYVPAGNFTMGAWPEDGYNVCVDYPPEGLDSDDCRSSWYERESPPHEVYLSAFWIQKTEVTITQYRKCVAEGQCRSSDQKGRLSNHPVTNITWEQAREYCQWAGLDLPSEAQWEKAARGPTNRLWPWGNLADTSYLNTAEAGINDTTAVGSYPDGESYYGLLDMGGNVWEFVYDWFDKAFYQSSAATLDDTRGPLTSPDNQRVRRGGGYGGEISGDINDGRVAARQGVGAKFPSYGVGFRCAGPKLP